MTEDVRAVYETLDSLQLQGNYNELNQIVQYAADAIVNDDEVLTLQMSNKKIEATKRVELV